MAKRTKQEIVQELQNRNIDFDGGASDKELLALLTSAEARDEDVNAPGATTNEDEGKPLVEPLESVTAQKVPVLRKERCWNCYAQDKKTRNFIDENGSCSVCGFEKSELYNGNIEADKAAQRVEAARAAEA